MGKSLNKSMSISDINIAESQIQSNKTLSTLTESIRWCLLHLGSSQVQVPNVRKLNIKLNAHWMAPEMTKASCVCLLLHHDAVTEPKSESESESSYDCNPNLHPYSSIPVPVPNPSLCALSPVSISSHVRCNHWDSVQLPERDQRGPRGRCW